MRTSDKFQRFFSVDSTKAIKAQGFGYINAINYMRQLIAAGTVIYVRFIDRVHKPLPWHS